MHAASPSYHGGWWIIGGGNVGGIAAQGTISFVGRVVAWSPCSAPSAPWAMVKAGTQYIRTSRTRRKKEEEEKEGEGGDWRDFGTVADLFGEGGRESKMAWKGSA